MLSKHLYKLADKLSSKAFKCDEKGPGLCVAGFGGFIQSPYIYHLYKRILSPSPQELEFISSPF